MSVGALETRAWGPLHAVGTPLLYTVGGVVLGVALPRLEAAFLPDLTGPVSAGVAIAHLSAIATGILPLTGLVFSLAFVMVQFSATAYSPRLVARRVGDDAPLPGRLHGDVHLRDRGPGLIQELARREGGDEDRLNDQLVEALRRTSGSTRQIRSSALAAARGCRPSPSSQTSFRSGLDSPGGPGVLARLTAQPNAVRRAPRSLGRIVGRAAHQLGLGLAAHSAAISATTTL
jgi:hypothetical protein